MGFDNNGMLGRTPHDGCLNVFALVIYIPDPLGRFLDELRRELVPHYNPHAHVSVLPPRPLTVDWGAASGQARALTESWAPFEIELTSVEIFPATNVIYLEIGDGASQLHRLHAAMNSGTLAFAEPFSYHPHITLAQEIPDDGVPAMADLARRRWQEYRGARSFRAGCAVLVRNTVDGHWVDLAEYWLGAVAIR